MAGSLGFVVVGLLLVSSDWALGVGTTGFFGACAVVFGWQRRALGDGSPALLDLRGGRTLTSSVAQRVGFLVVGLAAGVSSMLVGHERDFIAVAAGGLIVAAAVLGLVLQAFGVPTRTSVRFAPDGLHFAGGRAPCVLAFNNLARIQRAEWNGHVLVVLQPIELGALLLTVPERRRAAAAKQFEQSLGFAGAPLVLWPGRLGVDAGALMRSLERFVREPATRDELRAD